MATGFPFTNLTNVFFDKTSGEFVLKDIDVNLPPGLFRAVGFVHLQPIASTVWTIVHNQNTENISGVHIIEDSTNDQVFPDNIEVTDLNTVTISFGAAMSGRAMLVLFLS